MSELDIPFQTVFENTETPNDFRIPQLIEIFDNLKQFEITSADLNTSPTSVSLRAQEKDPLAIISKKDAFLNKELSENDFGIIEDVDYNTKEIFYNGGIDYPEESILHFSIYAQREDINAIIICNSPLVLEHTTQYPTLLNPAPNGSYNLAEQLLNYTESYNFINIEHLGFVALGKSLKDVIINVLKKLDLPEEALKEFY